MVTDSPLNFITFPRAMEKVATYDSVVWSMLEGILCPSICLSGETVHIWTQSVLFHSVCAKNLWRSSVYSGKQHVNKMRTGQFLLGGKARDHS